MARKTRLKLPRKAWQDAFNRVQIQWDVRQNSYNSDVLYAQDDAAIERYGLRLEDPMQWDFICIESAAQFAANMRVQRSVNIRNTYQFRLSHAYVYLEPMDLVEINDPILGLVNTPVRITKIEDDPKKV